MKTKKYIKHFLFVSLIIGFFSCSDNLDIAPSDQIAKENFFQSEDDFLAATGPLYNRVWFSFNDKFYFGLGDGRSNNLYAPFSDYIFPFSDFTETGLTGPLVEAWGSLYVVIQQSNRAILGIEESPVDEDIKRQYVAEARFMRGTAYWYLASLWGDAIISTDPNALVANPIVSKNPRQDVYEFAMRDLEFAAKYLPEQEKQSGRVTKYSAFGMLSRLYLSYAGLSDNPNSSTRNQEYLDLAKSAAAKVIEEGPYMLMDDYADLYKIENNNNSESMFALQWVPNGDYGVTNPHQAFFALNSEITGDDAAWGFFTRATYDVLQIYEANDLRRHATWMADGDFYPEISKENGGYEVDHENTYLTVKKGVVGSTKDNANISRMNSALNTYMLRLGEVYLNYAEATLGNDASTSDANALMYVNTLRARAGLEDLTSLSFDDLFLERRIELCMEGQFWYDLVRRSYYKQQETINYIIAQERELVIPFTYDAETNEVSIDDTRDNQTQAIGTIDEGVFLLPYPESEVVQNPLLGEDPVPYEFTEDRITDLFD
ncbi:RagB/SusD family nutrient uptake outer membrane protein [Flaviramulus sp. BrNp1-15]|uniref:RagB/SusD family nutrient uptake outer membrane protein n=1 Tax=Flaviramulus sp. BrNp1-15 TaxID=2916754 RepID=UPI001EE78C22|nr:RagB/SusD family nutrient uptake outer membrane protein [Flaviramulus sp. BrNp1-15]ULC58779.1 RagB/SusD family nutrient uptake outer membrane protein [Flaviramulus sp. BrNp1-15]